MPLRLVQIAVDARDDSAVGRFWAEALGWGVSSEEPGVTNVEPSPDDPGGSISSSLVTAQVAGHQYQGRIHIPTQAA